MLLPSAHPARARPPPRVLVAEDDAAMRGLLRDLLVREGYDVSVVGDGLELLDQVSGAGQAFDVVVSDVRMPVVSGLEVLTLMAHDPRPPFVIITAFADPATTLRALSLGAAVVLSKPFEPAQLKHAIRSLLARSVPAASAR